MVENLFSECPEVPELAQVVERRATATINANYAGSPSRLRVEPLPSLGQIPWTLVVFQRLEPVRVIRAQSMIGALALFVCYAAAVAAVSAALFYLLGRWRRRFSPALLLETAWWAPRGARFPVLAAFGFALMLIYWRSLDQLLVSAIFYSSIGVGISFLFFSATGLRVPENRPWAGFSRNWLLVAAAWLAAFALMVRDPWMAVLGPAGLVAVRLAQQRWPASASGARPKTPASWVLWTAELVVCLVILPTFGLGKMSYEFESGLYARELQRELSDDYIQQGEAIARSLRDLPGASECRLLRHQLLAALRIGEASSSPCAPTYFYGESGHNTQIAWAFSQREPEQNELLSHEARLKKEREEKDYARLEKAAHESKAAFQDVEAKVNAEKQGAAIDPEAEQKIAAEADRIAKAAERSEEAWRQELEAISREKDEAAVRRLAEAKAKSPAEFTAEQARIKAEKDEMEKARRAYVKKKQREQQQSCPLATWAEIRTGWSKKEDEAIQVPRPRPPIQSGRSCSADAGLVEARHFTEPAPGTDKPPKDLFGESAGTIQQALDRFPVLIMALVELPFDTRKEGFDMRLRQLQPGGAPAPWEWRVQRAADGAHFLWLAQLAGKGDYQPIARSKLPAFVPWNLRQSIQSSRPGQSAGEGQSTIWLGIEFWLGILTVTGLFLWWGRVFRQRVRLDGLAVPTVPIYDPTVATPARCLILCAPGYGSLAEAARGRTYLDLTALDPTAPPPVPEGDVLVDHLEACLATAPQRAACLDLMEALLRIPDRAVIVATAIEPINYLQGGGAGSAGDPPDATELIRWARVTNLFTLRRWPSSIDTADEGATWMSCSALERATLTYLDRENLVAPTAASVVGQLLSRNLLRRRPDGRIEFASPRFQRFVHALNEPPDESLLASHAVGKGISPWAIGIVLVGVVLFFSQEELTNRLLGFLTSVGAGLEVLRKHLATVSSINSGSSSSGSAKG